MKNTFAVLFVVGFCVQVSADAVGTTTQLSSGSATDQQNAPTISGPLVVWTNASTDSNGTNFDLILLNLTTGVPINLTSTSDAQEFLNDVDGSTVVWTRTDSGHPGDIVAYDTQTGSMTTVAASTATTFFQQPAVRGHRVAFLRVGTTVDVRLVDLTSGILTSVTNDVAIQLRPRLGDDVVVYEDYSNGNADIQAYRLSTGTHFSIATGPYDELTPDIDGHTIVWAAHINGSDQIFAFDLTTGTTHQLTTSVGSKIAPRISGNRVVWSDDRNGNLDIYMYDFSTGTEEPLVTGAGDQFLADIDGDRVVYTANATGFEQVYLFTFGTPVPQVSDLQGLVQSFNLKQGIAKSLTAKLGSAESAITTGDLGTACGVLWAFINEVQAQTDKGITPSQSNQLIAMATAVRSSLGCLP